MPRTKSRKTKEIAVDSYAHKGKKRKNNPHVGLVSSATDKLNGRTKYKHDPHIDPCLNWDASEKRRSIETILAKGLRATTVDEAKASLQELKEKQDPYLSWAGKREGTSFEVQNVSLHIHERVDSRRIIKNFIKTRDPKERQLEFFAQPENELALAKAIDFYRHEQEWSNRLIAGDSLLVMNSLLKKEGMAGKLQMAYIDPPYGIKYNSNFQPFTNQTMVKERDEDIPAEPEMIQAFRDTWELGVHSYLSYLQKRLVLARDLLNETGSCFVQISGENLGVVKSLMDEIFIKQNFVSVISFRTKIPLRTTFMPNIADYLIWYAKDINNLKFRRQFSERLTGGDSQFSWVELPNKTRRKMTREEKDNASLLPEGARPFRLTDLVSAGRTESCIFEFEYNGKKFFPAGGKSWKTNKEGIKKLIQTNRIMATGSTPSYIFYADDYPVQEITNQWIDTQGAADKIYVVQTAEKVVQRCMLMTTDPGDLVFDPTCGSGTTACVAEQWGRRWITCDTSRVAVSLAKQRLMTTKFDYYQLAYPNEGIRSGLKYRTVPHITLGSITNDELSKDEILYDQPNIEKDKVRVSGPFTVEAVPCLRVKPFDGNEPTLEVKSGELARMGETGRQTEWRDELKATGIRTIGGKMVTFSRVEPMLATRFLHADAEILESDGANKKAYISFGPDYGPLDQRQIEEAVKEARALKNKPDFVVFAAFHFDPEAAKDIDEINWPGVKILKAQMSVDLLTKDLRKNRSSSQSYWLIGQPDVEVLKQKDKKFKVRVNGFDYYDPVTGEIKSGGTKHIAMWFLDTDYDERSLCPDQVFFPDGDEKRGWTKLAKALNGEVNEDLLECFSGTESIPFSAGEQKKIAVKIVDNRGIESFVIKKLG